jgi:hypothetical protein
MSETAQGAVLPNKPGTVIVIRYPNDPEELFVRRRDSDALNDYVWLGLQYGGSYRDTTLTRLAQTPGTTWAVFAVPVEGA